MLRNIKLLVLKVMFIVALLGAFIGTLFVKKEYHYPVRWLLHFLVGSGKNLKVPDYIVVAAKSALERAMRDNDYRNSGLSGKYCVNHSTLYDGSGFHGRPTLFYLLGGFTFYYDETTGRVSGHDEYDWHSNSDGNYFTSPLGDGKVMTAIVKVMGKLFGDDLFVVDGWPSNETGISNKLWEEFYKVGAKSFNSVFDCYVEFDPAFLQSIKEDNSFNYFEEVIVGDGYSERVYNINGESMKAIFKVESMDEEGFSLPSEYYYCNFCTGKFKKLSSTEGYIWESKYTREYASRRSRRRDGRARGQRPQRNRH